MIPQDVLDKLGIFNNKKYLIANGDVDLYEKNKSGEVCLKCKLNNDTVVFIDPEKNTLPYLDESIKGAKACPDKFLFEFDSDSQCILHVMEFKKTINTSSIAKSKKQFEMGIYNARAIAGFLNFQLKEIRIYSAYRYDMIENMEQDTLIQMRYANINPDVLDMIREWRASRCCLNLDSEKITFKHGKIPLDQYGKGIYVLES